MNFLCVPNNKHVKYDIIIEQSFKKVCNHVNAVEILNLCFSLRRRVFNIVTFLPFENVYI